MGRVERLVFWFEQAMVQRSDVKFMQVESRGYPPSQTRRPSRGFQCVCDSGSSSGFSPKINKRSRSLRPEPSGKVSFVSGALRFIRKYGILQQLIENFRFDDPTPTPLP